MEMRCPVCKATAVRTPQCRRCKADLTLLFTLEEQRHLALAAAQQALLAGNGALANTEAARAEALRHGPDSTRLLALAALLQGDFARAFDLYRAG